MKKKTLAIVLAITAIVGLTIGGTLAWLTDKTQDVTNTFTVGNIDITLTETDADEDADADNNSYKMVPGNVISKDPTVTVKAGSETCWLFVKVEETGGNVIVNGVDKTFDDFITYSVNEKWTRLETTNETSVYYREVDDLTTATEDAVFSVIGYSKEDNTWVADSVLVNTTVTKEMMDALEADGAVLPKLVFTAYAVQKDNIATAQAAWAEVNK